MGHQEEYNRWKFRMGILSSFGNELNNINNQWSNSIDTIDERIKRQKKDWPIFSFGEDLGGILSRMSCKKKWGIFHPTKLIFRNTRYK